MNKLARMILVGATVVGFAAPAFAEWTANYTSAREALKNKDFRNAENFAIDALADSDAFPPADGRKLQSLELLSDVYRETRQWAAAAGLLEQIISAMKEQGTDGSPDAGFVYSKLGLVYQQMRENDKAQAAYEASLAIKRKKYKDNISSIAIIVTNLGELYRRKKDWPKAEELHKQAIADKEGELGPEHPTLVASMNNLALVYKETKRFDEALKLLERAKSIAQKGDNNGRNADMATALSNFGDVYSQLQKYPEAKTNYEAAIAMRKEVLGPQHPNVAESLNNYGSMLMGMKLLAEAVAAFDEAIEIRKLEYGATDTRTLSTMRNKAMALDMLMRPEDAAKMREEIKQLEARKQSPQ